MNFISICYFAVKSLILFAKQFKKEKTVKYLFILLFYTYLFSQAAKLSVKSVEILSATFKAFDVTPGLLWIMYYFIDFASSIFTKKYFKPSLSKNPYIYGFELSFTTALITFVVIHPPLLLACGTLLLLGKRA